MQMSFTRPRHASTSNSNMLCGSAEHSSATTKARDLSFPIRKVSRFSKVGIFGIGSIETCFSDAMFTHSFQNHSCFPNASGSFNPKNLTCLIVLKERSDSLDGFEATLVRCPFEIMLLGPAANGEKERNVLPQFRKDDNRRIRAGDASDIAREQDSASLWVFSPIPEESSQLGTPLSGCCRIVVVSYADDIIATPVEGLFNSRLPDFRFQNGGR